MIINILPKHVSAIMNLLLLSVVYPVSKTQEAKTGKDYTHCRENLTSIYIYIYIYIFTFELGK
jgi:hypothetical protein